MKFVMQVILSSILAFSGFSCAGQSESKQSQIKEVNPYMTEQSPNNSQVAEQYSIRLSDVPEVFHQLQQKGANGSFAVFMFPDLGKSGSENYANLQFSIENGKIGLDWVLLAPVNIRDKDRVFDFLKSRGAQPRYLTENEVSYLRAESGDLILICQDIMRTLYGVKNDNSFDFLPEGFEWKH